MRHLKVPDSDNIDSIGFEWTPMMPYGALEVVFKASPNEVYRYEKVGIANFIQLVSCESIGKQFAETFKKTKYPFTKSVRVVSDMINDLNKSKK